MTREEFCAHLIQKNGFKLIGPHTLVYQDDIDLITVYLERGLVIILADGKNVVASWNIIQVCEGSDTYFWDMVLQDVLHKF